VHWMLEPALGEEVTASADCGTMRLHGVLRHPVPPALVVPATQGWFFPEPEFRCGPPADKQQAATLYAYRDSGLSFPYSALLSQERILGGTRLDAYLVFPSVQILFYHKLCGLSVGKV